VNRIVLPAAGRVILTQRMALIPVVLQQNAAQIRVTLKEDAEHVVALTLQPVGAIEYRYQAWNCFAVVDARLHAQSGSIRDAVELGSDIETWRSAEREHVYRGEIREEVHLQFVMISHVEGDITVASRCDI